MSGFQDRPRPATVGGLYFGRFTEVSFETSVWPGVNILSTKFLPKEGIEARTVGFSAFI
jgi:hypothetical protein